MHVCGIHWRDSNRRRKIDTIRPAAHSFGALERLAELESDSSLEQMCLEINQVEAHPSEELL